ncbi:hypothetical protein [Bradyrhizobium sp. th.b2]|nr:hypothetical protein [Bradyrhizobium sp. th.b2]
MTEKTTTTILDEVQVFYNELGKRLMVFGPNCQKMRALLASHDHV